MNEEQAAQMIDLLHEIKSKLENIQQNTEYIFNVKKDIENIRYTVEKIKENIK
ncbi:hypothetical protein NLX78_07850 [Paenibacillus sp. Lou8.1]|uniref:hypothetical protein n=1 Tax=Paenibacillus sp. Lou8.1 TaxID=2962041 RepID=UPI0020B832C1|nr:hypothetical protein [Paenibacillus sp. Lou8.1]MCP3807145.1 hypothetical protein [Paenibacillus sp. Lou8.1]